MSIVAALDKVLFFNASSKYSVLRMKTEDSSVPAEARSPYRYHDHLIRFTAVGIELPQTDTVKIEMDGEWKDGKYGLQLQVDHWQEIVPPTLEGVRNYLASGLLKGIGEKTADAIIEKFGVNALEILEHQPDRLLEIRGITKERLAEIKDAYAETSRMRVLMTLLAPFKVTPTTAQKIYQHFGPACADIVRQSPFNLCQVPGFGFKRIDAIVQKSGGDLRDPKRVHGALFYALEDARTKDGHLYLEAESLLKAAMQLLNERIPLPQIQHTGLYGLSAVCKKGRLVPLAQERPFLIFYLGGMYEWALFQIWIMSFKTARLPFPTPLRKMMLWICRRRLLWNRRQQVLRLQLRLQ